MVLILQYRSVPKVGERVKTVLDGERSLVQTIDGDAITGECRAGQWIEHRRCDPREVPRSPGFQRNGRSKERRRLAAQKVFVREEEKCFVSAVINLWNIDWPAGASARQMRNAGVTRPGERVGGAKPRRQLGIEKGAA